MANRDFKPVVKNKTEDRLFFHPVYMLDAEGLTDALGDYEHYRDVTSPASRRDRDQVRRVRERFVRPGVYRPDMQTPGGESSC